MMTRKRHTPEQVVRKLTQADRLLADGKDVADVCRELQVSEQTYYRWRNQFGGLKADDAKKLKELERENATLKRGHLVALSRAVLPGHPAGEPLTHSHHRDEVVHGCPPACRAQKFPCAISFSAAFSSSASASNRPDAGRPGRRAAAVAPRLRAEAPAVGFRRAYHGARG